MGDAQFFLRLPVMDTGADHPSRDAESVGLRFRPLAAGRIYRQVSPQVRPGFYGHHGRSVQIGIRGAGLEQADAFSAERLRQLRHHPFHLLLPGIA